MRKWKVFWLVVSYLALVIASFKIGSDLYNNSQDRAVLIFGLATTVAGGVLFKARDTHWMRGTMRFPVPSGGKTFLNGTQRAIALIVAGIVILIQAYKVGQNGFDGIAWMLGLGLSTCLALVASHGMSVCMDGGLPHSGNGNGYIADTLSNPEQPKCSEAQQNSADIVHKRERPTPSEAKDLALARVMRTFGPNVLDMVYELASDPNAGEGIKTIASNLDQSLGITDRTKITEEQKAQAVHLLFK